MTAFCLSALMTTKSTIFEQICNEVFGEENFVATFVWEKSIARQSTIHR